MKKLTAFFAIACGLLLSNSLNAQSVAISSAKVVSVPGNAVAVVSVSGTLEGSKGIPITGYTVDLVDSKGKSVRLVTNQPSKGGAFNYITLVPASTQVTAPYQVVVTTNRQANAKAAAPVCSCN